MRIEDKFLVGKSKRKIPLWKRICRWEDNIKKEDKIFLVDQPVNLKSKSNIFKTFSVNIIWKWTFVDDGHRRFQKSCRWSPGKMLSLLVALKASSFIVLQKGPAKECKGLLEVDQDGVQWQASVTMGICVYWYRNFNIVLSSFWLFTLYIFQVLEHSCSIVTTKHAA
jgi:hypothetical protein